jgi:hypothetical protein
VLVIVGYVRIEKGRFYRHGERIARVRREKMGKKVEERPSFTQFTPRSVIRRRRGINAFTPVAGSSRRLGHHPLKRLYRLHFFIFVFHSKGKLNGNAQMPPLLAPLPSYLQHDSASHLSPVSSRAFSGTLEWQNSEHPRLGLPSTPPKRGQLFAAQVSCLPVSSHMWSRQPPRILLR